MLFDGANGPGVKRQKLYGVLILLAALTVLWILLTWKGMLPDPTSGPDQSPGIIETNPPPGMPVASEANPNEEDRPRKQAIDPDQDREEYIFLTVAGQVVDRVTSAPVEGAEVQARSAGPPSPRGSSWLLQSGENREVRASARTGQDGRFSFTNPVDVTTVVEVRAEGYIPTLVSFHPRSQGGNVWNLGLLFLTPSRRFEILVTDQARRPVAGAQVYAFRVGWKTTRKATGILGSGRTGVTVDLDAPVVTTGQDGVALLDRSLGDPFWVVAMHREFQPGILAWEEIENQVKSRGEPRILLELAEGGACEIVVRMEGERPFSKAPFSGNADISYVLPGGTEDAPRMIPSDFIGLRRKIELDKPLWFGGLFGEENERFRVLVTIDWSGCYHVQKTFDARSPRPFVVLVGESHRELGILAVRWPCENGSIHLGLVEHRSSEGPYLKEYLVKDASRGEHLFTRAVGRISAVALHPVLGFGESDVLQIGKTDHDVVLRFSGARPGPVRVRVRDCEGNPVARARVVLSVDPGEGAWPPTLGQKLDSSPILAGSSRSWDWLGLPGGSGRRTVSLPPGRGFLFNLGGRTDPAGEATIDSVPAGHLVVDVEREGVGHSRLDIGPARPETLGVVLSPLGFFSMKMSWRGLSLLPSSAVRVSLAAEEGGRSRMLTLDGDGSIEKVAIPSGAYRLSVDASLQRGAGNLIYVPERQMVHGYNLVDQWFFVKPGETKAFDFQLPWPGLENVVTFPIETSDTDTLVLERLSETLPTMTWSTFETPLSANSSLLVVGFMPGRYLAAIRRNGVLAWWHIFEHRGESQTLPAKKIQTFAISLEDDRSRASADCRLVALDVEKNQPISSISFAGTRSEDGAVEFSSIPAGCYRVFDGASPLFILQVPRTPR